MNNRRIKISTLIVVLISILGCESNQQKNANKPEAGTFRVAILYPNGEGKTFDMDYYEEKHMPMVAGFLQDNLKSYGIDKGIAGRTSNDQVPYLAIGYFHIANVADYNAAIAENRDAIISDFENYTNIQPVVQISEIRK